jgi:site-specific recombinase XerD
MVVPMGGGVPESQAGAARAARWRGAFLKEASLERDLAVRTRESYGRDLDLLLRFLERREVPLEKVATDDLIAFLASRRRSGDQRATRARRTAAIRSFFGWLRESGRIDRNPALLLPAPAPAQLLPKALDARAIERLLETSADDAGPVALRDRALLEVLYGAGLRASEAASLRLRDIDTDQALLRVMGKGRKERKVPLGNPGIAGLRQWIKRGRPRIETPESGDRVFITARGKPLSRDGVYRAVKRRVRLAGLDAHVSPHTLRHTFATHLVQNGADLRAVQEMLGHASINTTQVYTTLADEHLREAHRKHHPRG